MTRRTARAARRHDVSSRVSFGVKPPIEVAGSWPATYPAFTSVTSSDGEAGTCASRKCAAGRRKGSDDDLTYSATAVWEMKVGPSESAFRSGLQTTPSCCGQKPRW